MKLQISYDLTNLDDALKIAEKTAEFADILEVGTLLILTEGAKAVSAFKKKFPDKTIFADAKICDCADETIALFTNAGADVITVLAGTNNDIIYKAAQTAEPEEPPTNKPSSAINLLAI